MFYSEIIIIFFWTKKGIIFIYSSALYFYLNIGYNLKMKIVIAADSFKESLSSYEVANIIERAISDKYSNIKFKKILIADGGEGTVEAISSALNGEIKYFPVTNALGSSKINARWTLINDGKEAIIEVASVVGLDSIPISKRDPFYTTTQGIGELILHVLDHNVKRIFIGLGGSSTNDGGAGALKAMGVKFLDIDGNDTAKNALELKNLERIDISGLDERIKETEFVLLSDVKNPLCGPNGASHIFAGQKGANSDERFILDQILTNYQAKILSALNKDVSRLEGGGAAGGIGAGFSAFLNAELKSGITNLLELIDFENIITGYDLVITGEGKIDNQTSSGKAVSGVASICNNKGIPVIAVCAIYEGNKEEILKLNGLSNLFSIVNNKVTKEMSLNNPEKYLYECIKENAEMIVNLK